MCHGYAAAQLVDRLSAVGMPYANNMEPVLTASAKAFVNLGFFFGIA